MFSVSIALFIIAITSLFLSEKYNKKAFNYCVVFGITAILGYLVKLETSQNVLYHSLNLIKDFNISLAFNKDIFDNLLPPFIASIGIAIFYIKQTPSVALRKICVYAFSLISLIFLCSATNLLQILTSLVLVDVCASFLVHPKTKDRFIYYNFVANSLAFFAFCIIYAQNKGIELENIVINENKEVVEFLLSVAVAIKVGFWGLNNYLIKTAKLNENNFFAFLYLTTPLAGVVFANKLVFMDNQIVYYWSLASAFFYLIYFMIENNLKSKMMAFSLANFAMTIHLSDPNLMLASLLISFVIALIIVAASFENNISLIGGFLRQTKILYVVSLVSCFLYINFLTSLEHNVCFFAFEFASIVGLSLLIRQVFISKFLGFDKVYDNLKSPPAIYYVPILIIASFLFLPLYIISFVVFGLFFAGQFIKFEQIIKPKEIDSIFILNTVEVIFSAPIKFLGRILWLIVDFLFIERTIVKTSSSATNLLSQKSLKIEDNQLFWTGLGFLILMGIIGVKVHG